MAKVGRPIGRLHQDDVRAAWRFYVYEVTDADGSVIYIGKGSGNRLKASLRARNGADCRHVAFFKSEKHAYAYEVERIAEVRPALNRCAGGNGSSVSAKRKTPERKDAWQRALESIGSRAYAARLVLAHAPRLGIAISRVDDLRQVAYG